MEAEHKRERGSENCMWKEKLLFYPYRVQLHKGIDPKYLFQC